MVLPQHINGVTTGSLGRLSWEQHADIARADRPNSI